MANFSVSSPSRYHISGPPAAQPYSLPPSSGIALGEGLAFGLFGGSLLAAPVALRVNASAHEAAMVWLAALGLYGMLLGVLTATVRVARPLPRRTPALLIGLGFAIGPLAQLGTLLVQHTHHRPLGAATYAVLSAIICLVAWAAANQALVSVHSTFKRRVNFGWAIMLVGAAISFVLSAGSILAFIRRFGQAPMLSSLLLDGLFGMTLAILGGFARFPSGLERKARVLGPLAFGACVTAFAVAMQSPHTGPTLARASMLWAWLH